MKNFLSLFFWGAFAEKRNYDPAICEYLESLRHLAHEQVKIECYEDPSAPSTHKKGLNKWTLKCSGKESALFHRHLDTMLKMTKISI